MSGLTVPIGPIMRRHIEALNREPERFTDSIFAWLCTDQPLWVRMCHVPHSHYVLTSATIELERS